MGHSIPKVSRGNSGRRYVAIPFVPDGFVRGLDLLARAISADERFASACGAGGSPTRSSVRRIKLVEYCPDKYLYAIFNRLRAGVTVVFHHAGCSGAKNYIDIVILRFFRDMR